MELIKFKLEKNIKDNCIYFTPLSLNSAHPMFKGYKIRGVRINYVTKKVTRTNGYTNGFLNKDNFTIYISNGCDNHLNAANGYNQLFMFNEKSGLNKRMMFRLPNSNNVDNTIDFWYDRIIQSFNIISKYRG